MQKLKEILERCKASFSINVNDHKDGYEKIEEFLEDRSSLFGEEIEEELKAEIIKRDNIVEIQAYPDTPVESYLVVHYDLEMAIQEMHDIIFKES